MKVGYDDTTYKLNKSLTCVSVVQVEKEDGGGGSDVSADTRAYQKACQCVLNHLNSDKIYRPGRSPAYISLRSRDCTREFIKSEALWHLSFSGA